MKRVNPLEVDDYWEIINQSFVYDQLSTTCDKDTFLHDYLMQMAQNFSKILKIDALDVCMSRNLISYTEFYINKHNCDLWKEFWNETSFLQINHCNTDIVYASLFSEEVALRRL